MDRDGFSDKECFTFTWKIENFSYSSEKNGECILSPVFVVDIMGNTKWRLKLYPKGNTKNTKDFISFFLIRDSNCRGPYSLDIHYDLSFISADDSVLISTDPFENSYLKGKDWGYGEFVNRDEVLKIRREDYLPGNILTARCRIAHDNEVKNYGHCFARTRIGVERRSFVWNIPISSFEVSIFRILSTSRDQQMMTLRFCPNKGVVIETAVHVEVIAHDQRLKFSRIQIDLVDTSGNRIEYFNEEVEFDLFVKTATFALPFLKKLVIKNSDRYLQNNVLQLYCECTISYGIVLEEIEEMISGFPTLIQERNLSIQGSKSKKICLDSKRNLEDDLETLYKENLLCDTKLKTKTGSFPAHKSILCARSPVFKAMFTNDMREKYTDSVDIEDLDDDTVQRLLLYIYTATLPDLQWRSAFNLYSAADKYEILSLKSECFSFLKNNLSQDNACDILILADLHQDENLKSIVQVYILNQDNLFNTNEWRQFMKTNLKLAADLMYLKCTKKM